MAASASAGKLLAAALHRRTHRVTSALAHAALEWVLIALLLINGVLAYAIARFADYFGLAPPCLLCSRVDRLFQADGCARRLRDVLCGEHAAEISALGYCLSHRRLAEACAMCEACLSSLKEVSSEAGEKGAAVACSCCEALVRNSPRELQGTRKDYVQGKIPEEEEEEEDHAYAPLAQDELEDEEQEEVVEFPQERDEVEGQEEHEEKAVAVEDGSLEAMAQGEEIAPEDDRLVPVVALDEMTIADESGLHRDVEEGCGMDRADYEQDPRDVDIAVVVEEKRILNSAVEDSVVLVSPIPHPEHATDGPDENSFLHVEDSVEIGDSTAEEHVAVPQVTEAVPEEDDNTAAEVDTNCEVSIGSEICEHESAAVDEQDAPSAVPDEESSAFESLHDAFPNEQGSEDEQENVADTTRLDHLPDEQNETEEDKAPETPTYGVATPRSDRMFLLERKRSLSLSLDGSVASEMDGAEPSSVDQLKSALQAERKALSALYAELEEERNAAAIATNQTMAMINRLQEEKAAMQMEALQYQRMMEEQSEYDQEALQLMNELVTKREREKQELERELELYRHKLQHFEDKDRRRMASFKANGVSVSPSGSGTSVSSGSEDSDEPSDCELGESPDGGNLQSSSDAALNPVTGQEGTSHLAALDDSLTYFEMERLSILEELKTLEERLFTLEEDDVNTANAAADHSSKDFDLSAAGLRSPPECGFTSDKAKFGGRASICRGKSLLPLFDAAAGDDNCDQVTSARVAEANADNSTTKSASVLEKEQERLAIIEEVDHVYERLQALEADKEFLRHCIKSLKKGDKGMNLLQEILQHLRELRNVDLQVKNAGDAFAANSA
ncbi:hypothetical protein QOZ80_3BG0286310 [Eleusine coracana subsp. coracana]|nr:hypothetical protein QOZ80_3BG0286310 [Eleusine coracana subsp. coracana]